MKGVLGRIAKGLFQMRDDMMTQLCPVCGENEVSFYPHDVCPEEISIQICSTCQMYYDRDDVVKYDSDADFWFVPVNAAEALDIWRDRHAARLHKLWLDNEGSPVHYYNGVGYRTFYTKCECPCEKCGFKNTKKSSSCRVEIDGHIYCNDCARKITKRSGMRLSYSDGEYYLYSVYPWEIAYTPFTEQVLVNMPEDVEKMYEEYMNVKHRFDEWASREDSRIGDIYQKLREEKEKEDK